MKEKIVFITSLIVFFVGILLFFIIIFKGYSSVSKKSFE